MRAFAHGLTWHSLEELSPHILRPTVRPFVGTVGSLWYMWTDARANIPTPKSNQARHDYEAASTHISTLLSGLC